MPRRSGLSQAEFCRRRGILAGTLAFWKHTIGREAGAAARAARSMLAGPDARPTFLPVRIAPSAAPSPAAPTTMSTGGADGIEIVLSHGRLVRVRGPVAARWLGQVLVMLETPRC